MNRPQLRAVDATCAQSLHAPGPAVRAHGLCGVARRFVRHTAIQAAALESLCSLSCWSTGLMYVNVFFLLIEDPELKPQVFELKPDIANGKGPSRPCSSIGSGVSHQYNIHLHQPGYRGVLGV